MSDATTYNRRRYAAVRSQAKINEYIDELLVCKIMIGKCLCGRIQFEIKGRVPNLYQCHCSQCRKTTGSAANAATIIPRDKFAWLVDEDGITSFTDDSGYRSDFCSTCGSPVPNPLTGTNKYWVPAGLLEGKSDFKVAAHLYTNSKAFWDECICSGMDFDEMPDLETLFDILK